VRINPGEPFHSMRDTASGGELARIVLAVKKTLADQDRVPPPHGMHISTSGVISSCPVSLGV